MNPRADTKIEPMIVQQTLNGSAVGRSGTKKSYYIDSEVLRSYISLAGLSAIVSAPDMVATPKYLWAWLCV